MHSLIKDFHWALHNYINIYVYLCQYTRCHLHTYIHIYIHTYNTYTHTFIPTYVDTYVHTYVHFTLNIYLGTWPQHRHYSDSTMRWILLFQCVNSWAKLFLFQCNQASQEVKEQFPAQREHMKMTVLLWRKNDVLYLVIVTFASTKEESFKTPSVSVIQPW